MTCGIYMIQNKVNNKIYIGQAVDIEARWKNHKWELKGNHHRNKHLQRSWNRDGEDNFEFTIICECDESQLNTMEEYYIFELMSYDNRVGYNKNYGGSSGRPTEEARKKISENHANMKGENNSFYGKHHLEETKKKLSESHKDKTLSEETRKKMSEANARYWKGKTLSEKHRKKISENNARYWKGKTRSEETRKKISESQGKGVNHHSSISVVQLTLEGKLVNVFGSSEEAGRNGFNPGNINSCIKGKLKTHGGYKWMYLHQYISKMNSNIKTINLFNKTYEVNQEGVSI